nr:NYN domain-containing protein [Roseofilum acuticapitatum]
MFERLASWLTVSALVCTSNRLGQHFMGYKNRVSIFVDGNNMFYAQQKNGWFFDPKRVLEYFAGKEEMDLANAFWYTGIKDPQDQRGFRDALISLGYTVRTKILKEYYDDHSGRYSQKANLDIEIVIDMFNTVEQYDRVILFSGDGDFERAIELLRSKSTHITVVSTEGMIARELRNATDRYIDLNDIRPLIEKTDL